MIGSGKTLILKKGRVAVKKRYQINKQRALQKFKAAAQESQQEIQLALPLPEVVTMISRGLMNVAMAVLIKLAEEMMNWEVGQLVVPKTRHKWSARSNAGVNNKAFA